MSVDTLHCILDEEKALGQKNTAMILINLWDDRFVGNEDLCKIARTEDTVFPRNDKHIVDRGLRGLCELRDCRSDRRKRCVKCTDE